MTLTLPTFPHPTTPLGVATGTARALAVILIWALLQPYRGIALDAQLYAVQALARLHPGLARDLYMQNLSQDRYTIFSSIYAFLIDGLGLHLAALSLWLEGTAAFHVAAWDIVRTTAGARHAWLAVGLLIVAGGSYGAGSVFHIGESYLTARTVAEALVLVALACHMRGKPRVALALAGLAMVFHPIMALPGLLLVICLAAPVWLASLGMLAMIAAAFLLSEAALHWTAVGQVFTVMDTEWLGIVRERSQFLFLALWSWRDWEANLRPFLSLLLTCLVMPDARVRKWGAAAVLVGAAGLGVAFAAGTVGPVAILLQGQAWRWEWVTAAIGVLLVVPTLGSLWHDPKVGPICATLMLLAWAFEPADSLLCLVAALFLWAIRSRVTPRMVRLLWWSTLAVGAAVAAWTLADSWKILTTPPFESGQEPAAVLRLWYIVQLGVSAMAMLFLIDRGLERVSNVRFALLCAAVCAAALAFVLPSSLSRSARIGSAAEVAEFADWRRAIPPTSTVLVVPTQDAGAFVWFTLGRPNYLSLNQSVGVVFSRATALEVKRRSDVLLPLTAPDWRVLSKLSRPPIGDHERPPASQRLTEPILRQVCQDPQLGFVASPDVLGFDPIRHTDRGIWKDWNLYDCSHVRTAGT